MAIAGSALVGETAGLDETKGCRRGKWAGVSICVCVLLHMETRGQPRGPFLWNIHF